MNTSLSNAQGKGIKIKVLTYNIHHCNPPSKPDVIDIPAIAKVIRSSAADLVALQEVDVHTERSGKSINEAEELAKAAGMHYYFVKTIDYEGGAYGIAVLSKFRIVDSASYQLPMKASINGEPRGLAVITVQLKKGKQLKFACTHLDLKKENAYLQAVKIKELFAQEEIPSILCGDFNSLPESEALAQLLQSFTNSDPAHAFTIPTINPNRTIDYLLYRQPDQIKVSTHQVINETYASDHLPVMATFKVQ
ncbi:endonuclease/exonuclease/phosphatase family protein [Olivibacter ginsenosidimutans]